MHLRLKMKFLGAILVHPVRCQNFCWQIAPLILQHPRLWLIKNLVENWEICTYAIVSTAANRIKMKNLCSSSIFKPKRALQCWFEQLPSSRETPSSAKWPAFNTRTLPLEDDKELVLPIQFVSCLSNMVIYHCWKWGEEILEYVRYAQVTPDRGAWGAVPHIKLSHLTKHCSPSTY